MKEVLSLITFGIGALFFVVFFAAFRPDVVIAAPGASKPGYCDTKASPTLACRSLIFAAAMWPEVRQRYAARTQHVQAVALGKDNRCKMLRSSFVELVEHLPQSVGVYFALMWRSAVVFPKQP